MELSEQQLQSLRALLDSNTAGEPAAPGTPAAPAPAPYSLKLGGQTFSVANEAEANRLLEQYEAQRLQEVEAANVRAQTAQQANEKWEAEQRAAQAGAGGDSFDKEEYARLFLADPRKAQRYMLQHDPEQQRFFGALVAQINKVQAESAAIQFVSQNKDYVPTPENYQEICRVMNEHNLPWDLRGMNVAFTLAKSSGSLRSADSEEGGPAQPAREEVVAAPRIARRRTASQANDQEAMLERFESLSPDKMKAYLESLQAR